MPTLLIIVNTSFTLHCDCCSCWAQRTRCPPCYCVSHCKHFIHPSLWLLQLLSTADEVSKLQEELATMRPLLEEAVKESISTMEKIAKDTVSSQLLRFWATALLQYFFFLLPGCAFWQTWSVLHSSTLGCCTAVGIFFARLCVLTQSVLDYSALGCCTAVGIFFARFCVLTDMVSSPRVHFGPLPCCKVVLCQVHHCVVFFSSVFWRTWSVLHSLASGCCCGFCFAMRIILLFSPRRLCCFTCVFYKTLTVSSLTFFLWL